MVDDEHHVEAGFLKKFRSNRCRQCFFCRQVSCILLWFAFAFVVGLSDVHGEVSANTLADWPHGRGPYYDGTSDETELADMWPDEGPPVLWAREIGAGYSGLSVAGQRAITMTQTAYGQYVVCLDADTGEDLWRYRSDWPYDSAGMYPGPRATPTIANDHVFFAGPRGDVGCLRIADGSLVWSVNVIKRFRGHGFDFGYAASPLVIEGKVIVPAGGEGASVVALDELTGELVWKAGDDPASYGGAIPITFQGHQHVVVFLQGSLAAFDVQTGRLLWQHTFSQGYDEHAAAPVYREPHLLIASPFKAGAQMFEIALRMDTSASGDAGTGGATMKDRSRFTAKWKWDNAKLSNDTASSVLYRDHLFGFDLLELQAKRHRPSRGEFRCISWPDGDIQWSSSKPGHCTIIAADGKLLLFNDRGEIILADASPSSYVEHGRGQVFDGEICWTAPSLSHGRLYLRSPTRCACVFVGQPSALDSPDATKVVPLSRLPKTKPMDFHWLISGERPYPFDTQSADEFWRWFNASSLAFVAATILGGVSQVATQRRWPMTCERISWTLFWSATIVLGMVLTPLLNRTRSDFYFTWPLSLYAAFQLTVLAMVRAEKQIEWRPHARIFSRGALLAFVGVCVGYFLVCRRLSHSMEWIFLVGFVPCAVIAIPAAYSFYRPVRWWKRIVCFAAAFCLYYWSSAYVTCWLK